MPNYAVTKNAGPFVAGQNNRGVGTILTLTEKQAAHEVRLGSLIPVDASEAAPVPDAKPLADMTVKELRDLAEQRGIPIETDAKKDQIIAAIEDHNGNGEA